MVGAAEQYYPYLCTCLEDVANLQEMFGSDKEAMQTFSTCGDMCEAMKNENDDGLNCDSKLCDQWYLNADGTSCVQCEVAIDNADGSAKICNEAGGCSSNWSYNADTEKCVYDCTATETREVPAENEGDSPTEEKYCHCKG